MNTTVSIRDLFRSLCVALVVTLALATLARAQDKPAPAEPAPVAEQPVPAATPTEEKKTELRRLDAKPAADTAADAPDNDGTEPSSAPPARQKHSRTYGWNSHRSDSELISVGHDSHLAKGERADAVVSVFGSSTSEGEAADAVVSVFGDTRVSGSVGDAAVAVLGSTYVNGHVKGDAVAVGGDVELGPEAEVDGDITAVGGLVRRAPGAVVHGQVNTVSMGNGMGHMDGLRAWLYECLFHGRMLAFTSSVGWAWRIAVGFLIFYVLLALFFREGVEKCVQTFETRPGYSILTALLSVLIAPIVMILLAITGVGLVIVPFLVAALFFATLFGKAVLLAWLGRRFTGPFGLGHPALAVLVGGLLVLALYVVPVLGLVLFKLLGWVGMGVVIYALIQGMKREKSVAPPAPVAPVAPVSAGSAGLTAESSNVAEPLPPMPAAPPIVPVAPLALSPTLLARAGFWHRVAALLLDVILVGVITGVIGRHGGVFLPAMAIYGAVMWKLKGTTIGGIICGLKVVRLDDRPIDWATAIVRALGCFLSLAICFLGFIWVAFDADKQSWHDKIAGTVVVKSPKGTALV